MSLLEKRVREILVLQPMTSKQIAVQLWSDQDKVELVLDKLERKGEALFYAAYGQWVLRDYARVVM